MGEILQVSLDDLRAVARYAALCAEEALPLFERHCPGDARPRQALAAASGFANGGERNKAIRDHAFAAMRAGQGCEHKAAAAAARAAMFAASAAYLHPLAQASQVGHILGAAACAALAAELDDGAEADAASTSLELAASRAPAEVIAILRLYPPAPPGGGRAGALMRQLDTMLRTS